MVNLDGIKNGKFAERESINEAYKYFESILEVVNKDVHFHLYTVMHVMLNTIANTVSEANADTIAKLEQVKASLDVPELVKIIDDIITVVD